MTDSDFSALGMTWIRGLDGLWSAELVRGAETYRGAPRADLDEARALCLHAYTSAERLRRKCAVRTPLSDVDCARATELAEQLLRGAEPIDAGTRLLASAVLALTDAHEQLLAKQAGQVEQRQVLVSLASALSAAGFNGDDVVAGVRWLTAECKQLATDVKALIRGMADGQAMTVLLDSVHRYRREVAELRETLEAVNALGRSWGYGQGELDADLIGCLRAKLDSLAAKRVQ